MFIWTLISVHSLKLLSCKLCNNKYMTASTQISNTESFTFIAALVFKILSRKVLFINKKRQQKLLKSRLLFKKIANFTGKLLQNYKQLESEIFRILLKHLSDHLPVLFQFTRLLCTFKHCCKQQKILVFRISAALAYPKRSTHLKIAAKRFVFIF